MARFLLYIFCLAQLVIAVLPLARVVVFQGLSGEIFGTSEGAATLVMNMPVVASGFWLIGWLSLALLSYSFARLLAQQARMMKSLENLPAREAPARETAPREGRAREEAVPEEPRRERRAHREPPLTDAPPLKDEETEEPRSRRLRNEKPARQDKQRREPVLGTPGSASDER
ncbi:hypothetical protein [Fodinicurvata fenggangensis]|uniref:hypothetical protein n=1 Tax=Fodinicurvata fenggangensis TaxID=1121830 RepID=UPI00047E6F96|nr:hypothetical protein [Fodinicurvata fenggangensis]